MITYHLRAMPVPGLHTAPVRWFRRFQSISKWAPPPCTSPGWNCTNRWSSPNLRYTLWTSRIVHRIPRPLMECPPSASASSSWLLLGCRTAHYWNSWSGGKTERQFSTDRKQSRTCSSCPGFCSTTFLTNLQRHISDWHQVFASAPHNVKVSPGPPWKKLFWK